MRAVLLVLLSGIVDSILNSNEYSFDSVVSDIPVDDEPLLSDLISFSSGGKDTGGLLLLGHSSFVLDGLEFDLIHVQILNIIIINC